MVVIIDVDAFPFLVLFSDMTCHLEKFEIGVYLAALCFLIVRRLNLVRLTSK